MKIRKTERHVNLMLYLLDSRGGKSLSDIRENVEGYTDSADTDTLRRRFERDKDELRKLGIPIEVIDESRYTIDKEKHFLPEMTLEADEAAAVSLLVRVLEAVPDLPLRDEMQVAALKALFDSPDVEAGDFAGAVGENPPPVRLSLSGESSQALAVIEDAIAERKMISFAYRSMRGKKATTRKVEPYGRYFKDSFWYLVGHCGSSDDIRIFRLDRIRGEITKSASNPGTPDFAIPPEFSAREYSRLELWQNPGRKQNHSVEAELLLTDAATDRLRECFPPGADGVSRVQVGQPGAFVSWLVGRPDKVKLLGPSSLLRSVDEYLEDIIAANVQAGEAEADGGSADDGSADRDSAGVERLAGADRLTGEELLDMNSSPSVAAISPALTGSDAPSAPAAPSAQGSGRQGPRVANQMERLLVLIPLLIRDPQADLDELARVFGVPRKTIVSDLALASMTGVPPYDPYDMVVEMDEEDNVRVVFKDHLARPVRMTPSQAQALLLCLDLADTMPFPKPEAPLATLREKVRATIDTRSARSEVDIHRRSVWVELEPGAPRRIITAITEGLSTKSVIQITYEDAAGERTSRRLRPHLVMFFGANWYLVAFCELRGAYRSFRLDRISSAELVSDHFEPDMSAVPEHLQQGELFGPLVAGRSQEAEGRDRGDDSGDAPDRPGNGLGAAARLRVSELVARLAPHLGEFEAQPDGSIEMRVETPGHAWLVPWLLQWGPEASVISPPQLARSIVTRARELQESYRTVAASR